MLTALLYDPACTYQPGAVLWHAQYNTLATVEAVRPGPSCDLATLSFESPAARARWKSERGERPVVFGINLGGTEKRPRLVLVEPAPLPPVRATVASLAQQRAPTGSSTDPLPQSAYKDLILSLLDEHGGHVSTEQVQDAVLARFPLSDADWAIRDSSLHPVWVHRIGSAIKHLQRVRQVTRVRRGVYRRWVKGDRLQVTVRRSRLMPSVTGLRCPFCHGMVEVGRYLEHCRAEAERVARLAIGGAG